MQLAEGDEVNQSEQNYLESEIRRILKSGILIGELEQAASYAVFPAGKRIRPQLALSLTQDLNCDIEKVITAAAAIELLHCSSLIHDDLPALDNDDMRRGRPSCHKKFGEGVALLTGDALFAVALQSVAHLDAQFALSLAQAFIDLNNGQYLDIVPPSKDPSSVLTLFRLKTGALFGSACEVAAIAARGGNPLQERAREFGIALGVLFQVGDDIEDEAGDAIAVQIFSHVKEDVFRKLSLLMELTGPLPHTEIFTGNLLSKIQRNLDQRG